MYVCPRLFRGHPYCTQAWIKRLIFNVLPENQSLRQLNVLRSCPVYKNTSFRRPTCNLLVRFASQGQQKSTGDAPKYFRGKLVTAEEEDPTLYPKFLISLSSTDEPVLENYFYFVTKAAKMVDVDLTKSFPMPAVMLTYRARAEGGKTIENVIEYRMKRFRRYVEITNLAYDKVDILLNYIRMHLPSGVDMQVDLQRWEMVVDPNHPSLRQEQN